ncbi:phage shock protein A (IM30), suppresses sigma54-dependent transcription [Desulfitobacterium dehalogenans ATCC 51507]|uniref:Phage shock protein A (IM30), suppresses sigma54-dependent transcription n=1 Tax=Desulfitobacterium dehalogenans (strain ATCC 51507 / DSM 9161 / JW/IU-DC1) TaxID=756499 RepID=I4AA89_DESDJ|nr:PspA/IM30 family protein [Desulfitobacterium dehalogenans]AFM00874.1 phage shock protein A (IM30), suppresses sigma54-dependent transcription [Desulfitobacterium dehalogenans ATCC 51507]
MSILARFKEIMSSNINALLDKVEDPEKMIDQCLRNLNSDLGKVKSETATIMAEEQRAKRELDECTEDIAKMQSYAVKALEANNEVDAKKFLEHKASLNSKLAGLQEAYNLAQANAAHMREMHDKLVSDIGELESRRDMIKGKLAAAKTQDRMNKMMSSVSDANASIAGFERYEALADKALDKAKAMAELNKSSQSSIKDLAAKYDAQPDASIDDELAALKASLNK